MSAQLVEAFAAELPRLEAHESLRRMTEIAVGTGSVKAQDSRRIVNSWERASGQHQRSRAQTPEERLAAAAALGIAVVR